MSKKDSDSTALFDAGCLVELLIFVIILGGSYWWFIERKNINLSQAISNSSVVYWLHEKFPNAPIPFKPSPTETIKNLPDSSQVKTPLPTSSTQKKETKPSLKEAIKNLPDSSTVKTPLPTSSPQKKEAIKNLPDSSTVKTPLPTSSVKPTINPTKTNNNSPNKRTLTLWDKKQIRGIYLSRYAITNNANERTIRERVRYYKKQGFNTIIHGVWGNGCTMYKSQVIEQILGAKSCPNEFNEQWLNWLIDEAHKQGMEVHAYFEKGIKIDENSPIFDLAIAKKWIVPGVDKTYSGIEHYVLDVEVKEVADFFTNILVEFVKKYPNIDAVQWDDYLGYHAELPGKVDRTVNLTNFIERMIKEMKKANNSVSFDICHHNPYWAKKYFAADWEKWSVDRVFIQVYNDDNFEEELNYVRKYDGIAISEQQLHRLEKLVNDYNVKSVLVFPMNEKPEKAASLIKSALSK
ncbi:family 10 glycosylhydrolase [Okeania sp.]|uniref:family 10 glycosylhydrolase n=1 Tax=Okeania sp. TaxID=3100323 RepID=UPI002B4ADC7C|nr:family 10 glycosylhydrolase [Okeania sp.]MEB3341965.1 family 10 glycosylhydrolase [Okeania sp.]